MTQYPPPNPNPYPNPGYNTSYPSTPQKKPIVWPWAVGGIVAVLAVFVSCVASVSGTGRVADPSAGVNRPTESAAVPAVENLAFGEAFIFENGLEVTVSAPESFTPSPTATSSVGDFPAYLRFRVTIVNGTAQNHEASTFITSVQSTNIEGESVFDSAQGILGPPSTVLLPEREAVFDIVYGVNDPADIVMEVRPGFQYERIIYVS